jgi:histidine ammonia-lyase
MNDSTQNDSATIRFDGDSPLTLDALDAIFSQPIELKITDDAWKRIDASRAIVEKIAAGPDAVYGVNTGFGHLCSVRVDASDLDTLQHNLILSHAVGVGDPVPDPIVRWVILFKILSLTQGYSGVTRNTIIALTQMLNHDVLPIVPQQGSLGASGDLAPLSHMVLPLIGQGNVRHDDRVQSASAVFKQLDISPVALSAKEGLALINGTQFMSAYAAAILIRARRMTKMADIVASMSLEALQGSLKPFDPRLHELRPHPGAIIVAANMRMLLAQSEILPAHVDCEKVQDPYSLRCIPQVHGASRDAIEHASQIVEREINSVTDNPIIFDTAEAISGGNFHGQPIALALDYLAIALAELASISERRTYLLLSGHDGLPTSLMKNTGLNSGFMIPQYTSAALVSENKILCHPASVDSIPTSLGQEDHVSMGATAATKAWRVMNNLENVMAIEQMCAAQALDFRLPLKPGLGPRTAHETIRKTIPHADQDRSFGHDITASRDLLTSQRVRHAVEAEAGAFR